MDENQLIEKYSSDYDIERLKLFYSGKKILVTGGAGSIGSEIVRQCLSLGSDVVRVFDNNETELFNLEHEISSDRVRMLVGDIRDIRRLEFAMERIDIVFHAAALKHVPLCEYNPFEPIMTNVIGTQNVIDAAIKNSVKKVILVSTDKTVNAINVMGATKLLAERLITATNRFVEHRGISLSAVRFGNVLNSRGSLIPLFKNQIKKGFVTVTDPEMTRFIMTIKRAVELVLKAGAMSVGQEIFIFKMPAVRLSDLVLSIIEKECHEAGVNKENIDIRVIGKREGEKEDEELMTAFESVNAIETEDMIILNTSLPGQMLECEKYSSKHAKKLSKEEIIDILNLI